jgi:hypothetical protein
MLTNDGEMYRGAAPGKRRQGDDMTFASIRVIRNKDCPELRWFLQLLDPSLQNPDLLCEAVSTSPKKVK